MRITGFLTAVLALLAPLAWAHAQPNATPFPSNMPQTALNEQVVQIPSDAVDRVMLQATIFTPDGPGPFPLAVVNHTARENGDPKDEPRYRVSFLADYFLSRGYAVVMPMMRGYAGSGGGLQQSGCDYSRFALEDGADIRAVIAFVALQPNIDATRVVVAGQGFGGWNTLGAGALNLPNVKALVNLGGGLKVYDCRRSDDSLIKGAGDLGARARAPSLWVYGDNDRLVPTHTWRAMHDRYAKAGGKAELVVAGKFEKDSQALFSSYEGLRAWTPRLDEFLAGVGLPSRPTHPQYMPIAIAPPTRFAAVKAVDAVPYLNDQGRELYRKFLAMPFPRAFAIATNGSAAAENEGFDPPLAAINVCQKSGYACRLYAVDDDVVWNRPTAAPPPSKFAKLADVKAPPYLDDKGRDGYRAFLKLNKPRAFVIAPDGGWNAAAMGADPLAYALKRCGLQHQGCQLYAVDDDVVWTGGKGPGKR